MNKSNEMKKLLIVLVLIASGTSEVVLGNEALPKKDSSTQVLYYSLGGGKAVPSPGSAYITHKVTANFKAGFGYSCGTFDFQNNLSQMINQIQTQVREIPMQLQNAISAAVAGLPGYLMQKINPNLYNIVTKSLDETTELFRLSYKSCETMEAEMRNNDSGYNPYNGFMTAVVAGKWKASAEDGIQTIDQTKESIADNPYGPIVWLGGNSYGTVQRPIQLNHDLTIAGYNIMLGRTGDVSTDAIPIGALAQQPIVKVWPRPSDAGIWLQNIVGDKIMITTDPDPEFESISGEGLRQSVEALEPLIRTGLLDAIDTYDFTELNKFASLTVSNGVVDALRAMPLAERLTYMERLVSEMAYNEVFERIALIRQMLLLGLNHPENVSASISPDTEKYIRNKTFPSLDHEIDVIHDNLVLKKTTVNNTALSIISQHQARETQGIAVNPTKSTDNAQTVLDGSIPLN